jgi:hypothetical protein
MFYVLGLPWQAVTKAAFAAITTSVSVISFDAQAVNPGHFNSLRFQRFID